MGMDAEESYWEAAGERDAALAQVEALKAELHRAREDAAAARAEVAERDDWIDVLVAMPEPNRCVLALAHEPGHPGEPQVCPVVAFYVPAFDRWMISKPYDTRPMAARILAWTPMPQIPDGWLRVEATGRGEK